MRVFISGGCKSGKSHLAERLACRHRAAGVPLYYVATMLPSDGEDDERIARHRRQRAHLGFETVEVHTDILSVLSRCDPSGMFLLDATTALLANEMFPGTGIDPGAGDKLVRELDKLLSALPDIVIVSDMLCADGCTYSGTIELYRRELARLDRLCAARCELVIEVCAGVPLVYKNTAGVAI